MSANRASIGGNQPPDQIGLTQLLYEDLRCWTTDNPIVNDDNQKHAAEMIKRGRIGLQELDDERDSKVRPFNEQVKSINAAYRVVSAPLDQVVQQIKKRLGAHIAASEARRIAEAEIAWLTAQEAADALRKTQDAEREAIENAEQGEIGVDVGAAIQDTAQAKADAERAARAAAIAEKDITVRVSTGFGKAISMRTVEVLIVDDEILAVSTMTGNAKIHEAILSAARDYRKLNNKLPAGVRAETERKL